MTPSAALPSSAVVAENAASHFRRKLPWMAALLAAVLLASFLVGFAGFVLSLDRFEREPSRRADGIVALTGGSGRIGDAIDLLAKGYGDRLLITGVNERTSREEIARLNPHQRELVECCVDLDYRAQNTVGNAAETSRWAHRNGFASLILVTSNYHMPRSLLELSRSMPDTEAIPYAVVTTAGADGWMRRAGAVRLLFSEYVKFLGAHARNLVMPALTVLSEPARSEPAVTSATQRSRVFRRVATGSRPG